MAINMPLSELGQYWACVCVGGANAKAGGLLKKPDSGQGAATQEELQWQRLPR